MLFLLYDVESSYVNAGMPEKSCPASAFLPAVHFFSPASAFRHQGQSGTAGHRLVRHCPAMAICIRILGNEKLNIVLVSQPLNIDGNRQSHNRIAYTIYIH